MSTITINVDLKICVLVTLVLVGWLYNEIEKRHSLERVISEKNRKLENDIYIIKLTLGKISDVLETDVLELKQGLSHVNEELKHLKADVKLIMEETMGISDKVEEIHSSVTNSGLFSIAKKAVQILCSISAALGYFFPKLHVLDSVCSISYYL